ncbi:hypothetical protein [Muricoccus pecuniae]|uniref:Uncharacterized protein n=1 Tax=Muricoccus pecuniae TaxID=693023 RepID=A0A840YI35_9PROT|nr:hypothetical protein [Roseomonas pecuniae]MBB5696157.1 hypothetical protein [Roseomonas pecuniae]
MSTSASSSSVLYTYEVREGSTAVGRLAVVHYGPNLTAEDYLF